MSPKKQRAALIRFYLERGMVGMAMALLPRLNTHEPLAKPVPHGPRDRHRQGIKPKPLSTKQRRDKMIAVAVKRIRGVATIAGAYPPGTPGRKKARRRVRQALRTHPIALPSL